MSSLVCDEFELLVGPGGVSNATALSVGGERASNLVCVSLCTPASLQLMGPARAGVYSPSTFSVWLACCSTAGVLMCATLHALSPLLLGNGMGKPTGIWCSSHTHARYYPCHGYTLQNGPLFIQNGQDLNEL